MNGFTSSQLSQIGSIVERAMIPLYNAYADIANNNNSNGNAGKPADIPIPNPIPANVPANIVANPSFMVQRL